MRRGAALPSGAFPGKAGGGLWGKPKRRRQSVLLSWLRAVLRVSPPSAAGGKRGNGCTDGAWWASEGVW